MFFKNSFEEAKVITQLPDSNLCREEILEVNMSSVIYRAEPGRYRVTEECRGEGRIARSGVTVSFRGVDVSPRGFGCIVKGVILPGDSMLVTLGGKTIALEVMWSESHLGIENMYRVGLSSLDAQLNIEAMLNDLGLLEDLWRKAS